uniref:CBL-interacting protein kinase 1 n=1 Tax=Solanum tuberosum TaxID=4113 RepID=M1A016_SOLTU
MVLIHHQQQQQQEEEIVRRERGKKGMRVGKYELGRTLGEGNFGKVKFAKHTDSAQSFAIKILEKNRIQDLRITDQVCYRCSLCIFFRSDLEFRRCGV